MCGFRSQDAFLLGKELHILGTEFDHTTTARTGRMPGVQASDAAVPMLGAGQ